jgi:hypothetical protein
MYEDGPRGVQYRSSPTDEHVDDLQMYGVDWEDAQNPTLMNHLLVNNPQEWDEENPFNVAHPQTLSNVPCEPPNCPLTPPQIQLLDSTLRHRVNMESRSMVVRRAVWENALEICNEIYST